MFHNRDERGTKETSNFQESFDVFTFEIIHWEKYFTCNSIWYAIFIDAAGGFQLSMTVVLVISVVTSWTRESSVREYRFYWNRWRSK